MGTEQQKFRPSMHKWAISLESLWFAHPIPKAHKKVQGDRDLGPVNDRSCTISVVKMLSNLSAWCGSLPIPTWTKGGNYFLAMRHWHLKETDVHQNWDQQHIPKLQINMKLCADQLYSRNNKPDLVLLGQVLQIQWRIKITVYSFKIDKTDCLWLLLH